MAYDVSRLPFRGVLYDEVKPLSDAVCLGLSDRLHTRDTLGTVFRLLDLGVEPYMLAQGLNLVLAQRLVH